MSPRAPSGGTRSGRLRLIVIQALVFSLFATLFVRLYYLQVVGGDEYHAQAASQSVREIVVQPQRGLIVDDMGRPLVANRTSWVVSVDRTMLDKMTDAPAGRAARAGRRGRRRAGDADPQAAGHLRRRRARSRASAGTARRTSRSRSPPTSSRRSRCGSSSSPRTSRAIVAEQQSVRAYPQPYGVNLAHVLGYLSPITEDEFDQAERGRRHVGQRRLLGRPRRHREAVRPLAARHARLQERRGRLDGPGARRRRRGRRPAGRHPGHQHRRQGPGRRRAAARRHDRDWRGRPTTRSPTRTTSPTRAPSS